jgi:hypothetical protein
MLIVKRNGIHNERNDLSQQDLRKEGRQRDEGFDPSRRR